MPSTNQLAEKLDVDVTRLHETIRVLGMPMSRTAGVYFVEPEIAERLTSIYRNAASQPTQEPRPTPHRLREEYLPGEEHDRPPMLGTL